MALLCRQLSRAISSSVRLLQKPYSAESTGNTLCSVHPDLLKVLVCPLSKDPLRYSVYVCVCVCTFCQIIYSCRFDAENNELICDKLSVAYPIMENGVPNLVPQDARMIEAGHTETNR